MSNPEDYSGALVQARLRLKRINDDIAGLDQNMGKPPRPELATAKGYASNYLPLLQAVIDQMEAGRITEP